MLCIIKEKLSYYIYTNDRIHQARFSELEIRFHSILDNRKQALSEDSKNVT